MALGTILNQKYPFSVRPLPLKYPTLQPDNVFMGPWKGKRLGLQNKKKYEQYKKNDYHKALRNGADCPHASLAIGTALGQHDNAYVE